MDKINFFTELVNRWSKAKPIFFIKVQRFGLALGTLSVSLIAIPAVDDRVQKFAGYLATAAGVIAFFSQFTVKKPDYPTLDKKEETPIIGE
jgi:hypothetical protein